MACFPWFLIVNVPDKVEYFNNIIYDVIKVNFKFFNLMATTTLKDFMVTFFTVPMETAISIYKP